MAVPVQVVPQGIEVIHGSSTDMGCTSALVDSGDVMTCNSQSYLVDGCSPDIDTCTCGWTFQLVTVRRNEGTYDIPVDHVLLTFGFDTAVSLTGIEMDLFLCPDWGIGAPLITAFLNEEYDLALNLSYLDLLRTVQPSQSSCNSLATVHLSGDALASSYRTFHILVTFSNSSIEWVYIGEVRFISEDGGAVQGRCYPTSFPQQIHADPSPRDVIEMTSTTHAVQKSQKLTSKFIIYGKGKSKWR